MEEETRGRPAAAILAKEAVTKLARELDTHRKYLKYPVLRRKHSDETVHAFLQEIMPAPLTISETAEFRKDYSRREKERLEMNEKLVKLLDEYSRAGELKGDTSSVQLAENSVVGQRESSEQKSQTREEVEEQLLVFLQNRISRLEEELKMLEATTRRKPVAEELYYVQADFKSIREELEVRKEDLAWWMDKTLGRGREHQESTRLDHELYTMVHADITDFLQRNRSGTEEIEALRKEMSEAVQEEEKEALEERTRAKEEDVQRLKERAYACFRGRFKELEV